MKKLTLHSLNVAILALLSAHTFAESEQNNNTSTQPHKLDTIVVTASGFEQKVTDAPASVTVISEKDFKNKRINSLADALKDVEGIDVSPEAGKTGGLNIKFRGMSSDYTLILVDGRRQNSAGDITPNAFGETKNSFIPPISAIDRIEVIRGPASTLYGSDAMGGVVNIITKKISDEWTGQVKAETTIQPNSSEFGNHYAAEVFAMGPLVKDLVGVQIRARQWNREHSNLTMPLAKPVTTSDGTTLDRIGLQMGSNPTKAEITTIGGRLTFTPTQNHEISLDAENIEQTYDNSRWIWTQSRGSYVQRQGQLGTVGAAGGYDTEQEYNRTKFVLSHVWNTPYGTLDSSVSHNNTETLGRLLPARAIGMSTSYVPRQLESEDLIFDTKFSVTQFDRHNLIVGGQWWDANLKDGLRANPEITFDQLGLFVENTWQVLDNLAITVGGRYDDHSSYGDFFTPRAYVVWNTNEYFTLKGGYSEGYKVPRLEQLTRGLYNVGGQGATPILGNPDLKPETSENVEFGVYFDALNGFKVNITYFENKTKNKITTTGAPYELVYGSPTLTAGTPINFDCRNNTAACDAKFAEWGVNWSTQANDNLALRRPYNAEGAKAKGIEFGVSYDMTANLSLMANYTWTDSEVTDTTGRVSPDTNNPEHLANLAVNWNVGDNANLWLRGEYRSNEFRSDDANYTSVGLGDYKGYTQWHIGSNIDITPNLGLGIAIYNVLDKKFSDYKLLANDDEFANAYKATQEGRRFQISTTFKF
ncbi:TonB-dependent receptor domain-containing protein [Acinetobacter puyangensis]|uniref:TonB-dependent receptor domain-containing protein n=1 Tax=Acinetobacter puyangensis TaxID=1096779 RepID=UPI003A4E016D